MEVGGSDVTCILWFIFNFLLFWSWHACSLDRSTKVCEKWVKQIYLIVQFKILFRSIEKWGWNGESLRILKYLGLKLVKLYQKINTCRKIERDERDTLKRMDLKYFPTPHKSTDKINFLHQSDPFCHPSLKYC